MPPKAGSSGFARKAGHSDVWEKMYDKREKEKLGQKVENPGDTLRRMYDQIIAPRLEKKGIVAQEVPQQVGKKEKKDKKSKSKKDKKKKKKKKDKAKAKAKTELAAA